MKITDDMIERGLQAYQEPWWSIDAGCGSHSDRLTVRRILILALSDFHMTTPKEEPCPGFWPSTVHMGDCYHCGRMERDHEEIEKCMADKDKEIAGLKATLALARDFLSETCLGSETYAILNKRIDAALAAKET